MSARFGAVSGLPPAGRGAVAVGLAPAGSEAPGREVSGAARGPETLPKVRRSMSLAVAGFSILVMTGLVFGANVARPSYAVVAFGVQALFVVAWTTASRPPAPWVVGGVGLLVAAGADAAAIWAQPASLAPLGYLTAAGFVAGVIGQLLRPAGRIRVTESLGSSLVVMVGVVAFATLIELTRHPLGTQALMACLLAAGVAVAVARTADVVLPLPRVTPQVPRGGFGVVLGAMAGTAAAATAGYYLAGLDTTRAGLAGLVTVLVAVMVDLSIGYAEASRHIDGDAPALWLARHLQGPLGAFAFSAPAGYVASVVLLNIL